MSTSAISPILNPPSTTVPSAAPAASNAADSTDALANESTFLQLLVTQLKNQTPDQPADGTEFVSELAQFATLEQDTQSRTDLDSILQIQQTAQSAASPAAQTSGNSSTAPSGTTPASAPASSDAGSGSTSGPAGSTAP